MKGMNTLKTLTQLLMALVTIIVLAAGVSGHLIQLNNLQGEEKVIVTNILYIFAYVGIVIFDLALYQLLKIIKSIEKRHFFRFENIKRFKNISWAIWYFVVVNMIINAIAKKDTSIIDFQVVILMVAALFTQVLSGVFYEAYKLKESEELLKEENKLVI